MKTWARMLLLALALSSCEPYPPGYYNGYPGSGYSGPPSYYGSGYYSSHPSYYPEPNGYPVSGGYYNPPHHRTTPNLMVIRGQVGNID